MLIPGYDADIVVFDKQFNILASIIGGTFKKNLLYYGVFYAFVKKLGLLEKKALIG